MSKLRIEQYKNEHGDLFAMRAFRGAVPQMTRVSAAGAANWMIALTEDPAIKFMDDPAKAADKGRE